VELKSGWTSVKAVAFSPDGALLVTLGEATASLWDAATGSELAALRHETRQPQDRGGYPLGAMAISPDGQRLATAAGQDRGLPGGVAGGGESGRSLPAHIAEKDENFQVRLLARRAFQQMAPEALAKLDAELKLRPTPAELGAPAKAKTTYEGMPLTRAFATNALLRIRAEGRPVRL